MLPGIFVLLMVIVSVQGTEPECSRFHYEEQTLEKMIRQEMHVERMKAEIGETKKQVDLALEDLKQERETFKTEIDEIKKAQNLGKENLVREQAEIRGTMLHVTPAIAFQAKVVKNTRLTNGETLIFKNTVFDFGNGYNNQTGLFTVTQSGLYLFSIHLCLNSGDAYLYYEVFTSRGATLNGQFATAGGKYYSCLSIQILINMQSGDAVGVRRKTSSFSAGNTVIYEMDGYTESVFSGVLINSNG